MNEVSTAATGRQPVTLAGLREFLSRCEAASIPDTTGLRATVDMGGRLKRLTARDTAAVGAGGSGGPA